MSYSGDWSAKRISEKHLRKMAVTWTHSTWVWCLLVHQAPVVITTFLSERTRSFYRPYHPWQDSSADDIDVHYVRIILGVVRNAVGLKHEKVSRLREPWRLFPPFLRVLTFWRRTWMSSFMARAELYVSLYESLVFCSAEILEWHINRWRKCFRLERQLLKNFFLSNYYKNFI